MAIVESLDFIRDNIFSEILAKKMIDKNFDVVEYLLRVYQRMHSLHS